MDVGLIPFLHLHNLPHQPIDIAQQPPNMPDGHAQVVIDHVLHVMDDFLAVTVASARFFTISKRDFLVGLSYRINAGI